VLASSGLLTNEIGGPSVNTYQPKGIWEAATSGRGLSKYIQDHGEKLYRKSMYTFIKRTVPPPSMLIFDGSNRDQCEVKRMRTNTPLQALVMMNDPQVLEASRVLAERIWKEELSAEGKIEKAFRLIVSRRPTANENSILLKYYNGEIKEFGLAAEKVDRLMSVGEFQREMPSAETAALMETVLMIYNMDEAVVK
jgi:Protein of unknown function (DUF1553)